MLPIDFITVVFDKEIDYLSVQAKSISLCIDSDSIGTIFVIVNDDDHICEKINVDWWGENRHKVNIISKTKFGRCELSYGWNSQQLYKLFGASIATNKWSMCLDAKTWFVQKLDFNKIFDETGRVNFHSFPTLPVFKPAEEFVEKFYNIESKEVIGPGGVPFFFHTQTVIDLIADLEDNHNTTLLEFFSKNVKYPVFLTEFMLYSGFVKYKYGSHDKLYSQQQYYLITNVADFQKYEFDKIFVQMQDPNNLTASIHRSVYPYLTEKQLQTWVDFLHSKNLIDDTAVTYQKLNTNTNI